MKKILTFGLFLGVILLAFHALRAEAAVDVKSGIAGTVTWRAEPGSTLAAGAEIVRVRTARAEEDCSVSEMLVSVGDDIAAGQVVARLKKQDE